MLDKGYFLLHNNAIFDIAWLDGDTKIVTGAGDRKLRLFDVASEAVVSEFGTHISSIRCLRPFSEASPDLFASCCRGGRAVIWDVRSKHPVKEMDRLHSSASAASRMKVSPNVACVSPSKDDLLLASAGTNDGKVKFWDIRSASRKSEPVKVIEAPERATMGRTNPGISCINFDPTGSKLAVNYLLGGIAVFDWLRYTCQANLERSVVLTGSDKRPYSCASFYSEFCCGNYFLLLFFL